MQRMGAGASNDKEIGSFKTTAQVAMDSFLNINIRKITSTNNENEINFVNFIEKKTIIYLGLDMAGEDSSASNKLACLFMQLLYNELTKYLRKNNLESYEKPKLFIIDEFANIPKMPFIPKMYVLNRSNNIFALPVIQDINQLRKTYKDDYLTMLNNVSFTFITGNLGVDDAKYYCDKIGKN
jgi:type IV secretion system protein VirD4